MIRAGTVGDRGLLTDAERARIDAHFQARLAQLGSDFPYADHFPLA